MQSTETSQTITFDQLPAKVQILSDQVEKLTRLIEATESEKPEDADLVSFIEACAILKCTRVTGWKYAKQGVIKTYKIGNKIYAKRSEIHEAITNRITKK